MDNKNSFVSLGIPKYFFALFLIEELAVEQIYDQIVTENKLSIAQSQKFLNKLFQQGEEGGIELSDIKLDPMCSMLATPIVTPARGKFCTHLNCFSLMAFLQSMQNNYTRSWSCPICKKFCYEIKYDSYVDMIINEVRDDQIDSKGNIEIFLKKDGNFDIQRGNPNEHKNKRDGNRQNYDTKPVFKTEHCSENSNHTRNSYKSKQNDYKDTVEIISSSDEEEELSNKQQLKFRNMSTSKQHTKSPTKYLLTDKKLIEQDDKEFQTNQDQHVYNSPSSTEANSTNKISRNQPEDQMQNLHTFFKERDNVKSLHQFLKRTFFPDVQSSRIQKDDFFVNILKFMKNSDQ